MSTHTYDKTEPLNKTAFLLKGWSFNGWHRTVDGKTVTYEDGAYIKNWTATNGEVISVYTDWIPNVYGLRFDEQYATVSGTQYIYEKYDNAWYKAQEVVNEITTITTPKKQAKVLNPIFHIF